MNMFTSEATTLASCWLAQRPDGAGVAVTSHDAKLRVKGVVAEPGTDLVVDELVLKDCMFGSQLKLGASLSSDAISMKDLVQGRWSETEFKLYAADWHSESQPLHLCQGELRSFRSSAGTVSAEASVLPRELSKEVCQQTSPECRALLGDDRCRVSLRKRQSRTKVISSDGPDLEVELNNTAPYLLGRIRWLSGENCGLDESVVDTQTGRLTLRQGPRGAVRAGDDILLTEGCDGRRITCSARFSNVRNFRGEPDLPGTDVLMRYPGA